MTRFLAFALLLSCSVATAEAQKVGYVDSDDILSRLTDYQTAQQEVDRLAQQWQAELDRMKREIEEAERDFAARELLYTEEERAAARQAIEALRRERDGYRTRHFGPTGELFKEQQQRMRPVQERVLEAIEAVAEEDGYEYVFDRAGEFLFLYAAAKHDLSDRVLDELGVPVTGN
jgi:outer membrane protein